MKKLFVPIVELQAIVNPLDGKMWRCNPITIAEVTNSLDGETLSVPWNDVVNDLPPCLHHMYHVLRIAHLVKQPSTDPIILAVSRSHSWIYDGNHRLAAAIVSGSREILVHIASSEDGLIEELFPGARPG